MARISPIQTNFTAGELSPHMAGRVDISKYNNGCFLLQNFVVLPQGGITRRQGFKYCQAAKYNNKKAKLIPFKFSTLQAYVIEAGDLYFRFFKDNGQIITGPSTPYELASPYTEAMLDRLQGTQSTDTLYLCHRDLPPKKLTRTSHTSWTITDLDFIDGPYLDTNTTATTLTPSATTGAITITASSTADINKGQGFLATDVGRLIRIANGATWGYAKITAWTSSTVVSATVKNAFAAATATKDWAIGAWSNTTGWPQSVAFYEERLWFGGNIQYPQTLWGSMSGAYEAFSPTQNDKSIVADNGLSYTLSTNDVNDIVSMNGGKVLSLFTSSSEFTVSASSLNEAITPTNVKVTRETRRGIGYARIVGVDSAVMFWQKAGRKLREYSYDFQTDSFKSVNLTILSNHISKTGIKDMDFQQEPNEILWCNRNDGLLIGLTYCREQEVIGWHRHPLGGTNAKVLSLAVIPSVDGSYDEVWAITERTISGSTVRYVEYMSGVVEPANAQDKNNYTLMDCCATYSGAPTTTISGLTFLIGETVSVLADGAAQPDCVVNGSGVITIQRAASVVQVGLKYKSAMRSVNWEAGGNEGTSQGKIGRLHKLAIRFHESLGGAFGPDETKLELLNYRTAAMPMGKSPELFTGDKEVSFDGDYLQKRQVYFETDQPYPCTILAVLPVGVVYG